MDGKERRIEAPSVAGAQRELSSVIVALPVFMHIFFSLCSRKSEGRSLERFLGLPEREGGWRDI